MFALRRSSPRVYLRSLGVRGYADAVPSEAVNTSATPPPPPPPAAAPVATAPETPETAELTSEEVATSTKGRGRPRPGQSIRPSISLERPREWNRPIASGVLPAYDLAFKYIREDSENLKKELEEVRGKIKAAESLPESEQDAQALRKMRAKADILEIQSEVNLPDVRWKARNGLGELYILSPG